MYESTTYDVILDRMLARVPDTLDKREGSVIWDTHSPTAIELQNHTKTGKQCGSSGTFHTNHHQRRRFDWTAIQH